MTYLQRGTCLKHGRFEFEGGMCPHCAFEDEERHQRESNEAYSAYCRLRDDVRRLPLRLGVSVTTHPDAPPWLLLADIVDAVERRYQSIPDAVLDNCLVAARAAAAAEVADEHAKATAETTARIVAWLRSCALGDGTLQLEHMLADAIERGAHLDDETKGRT